MGLLNKKSNNDLNRTWDGKEPGSPNRGIFGSPIYRDPVSDDEIVWKYSFMNVRKGAKIFVKPTQRVLLLINNVFVTVIEGGQTFDLYDSANFPILENFLNFATGGETPYPVDIWFFNVDTHRNMLWSSGRLHVTDIDTNIPAEMYCNGSCIIKIKDVSMFYRTFVGTKHEFSVEDLYDNLRNIIRGEANNQIREVINKKKIPLYDFQSNLREITTEICLALQSGAFEERGIELLEFRIGEVDFSEDFKENIRVLKLYSSEAYLRKEQLGIMKEAAANPGAGIMMGMGMGAGMGLGMGNTMGNMMQNTMGGGMPNQQTQNPQNVPPPIPVPVHFFVLLNGAQSGPFDLGQIQAYVQQGVITKDTLVWKNGMPAWGAAHQASELAALFQLNTPPPPPPPSTI